MQTNTPTSSSASSDIKSPKHNDNYSLYQYFYFCKAVNTIFSKWTALTLARQHSASGGDTDDLLDEFQNNIKEWISNDGDQLEVDEVVQYMNDVLEEDLGIDILDGSIKIVSKHILILFKQILNNNFTEVIRLLSEKQGTPFEMPSEAEFVEKKLHEEKEEKIRVNHVDSDDEDANMADHNHDHVHVKEEPEIDEDGFQTVKKKSGGRRH
ncbi:predicted protein [Naegleria gruberi]|uniref:Predicted protein n=1 Tax=Naegleria gruberi TaxID=5762 RepID=D2VZ25_NAEGR|nr:uncharacterized protein NAEGRDRAFT_53393 [Naegleria gruberi]EFC37916.1 predicted protein [Naegleria gruberi]|eukprot:XP_002670660.1 predicted protein [Naegleria gruberi strain NEG-M]